MSVPERMALATAGITHRFRGGDAVLHGIDLRVPAGAIYGLLGANGAGKTTTLRLVLGLLPVQAGSVTVFGQSLARDRIAILARVGSLIESPSIYEHLTARENLEVLDCVRRCPRARIDEVLELVGLAHAGRKKAGAFSLGMKQRLGLAGALLHRPSLLVLDEPTNGLDPPGIVEMRALLARLNCEEGVTILLSSHLLPELEKLVTHVGVLDRGRLAFQGTIEELRALRSATRRLRIATNDDVRALHVVAALASDVQLDGEGLSLPRPTEARVAEINRALVASGIDVHALQAEGGDLESIFLGLISERAA
jgi:lantibiotic transport system ATP-binding protein